MLLTLNSYFSTPPVKIVSLVPSITELLFDLGLRNEVAGITKFCVHPEEWFKTKTRVGGTKTVNIEIVEDLQPDLIIVNKEENEKSQVEILARQFNIWLTDVKNLEDATNMIIDIGLLVGKYGNAKKLSNSILTKFKLLKPLNPPIKTAYFIWRDPYIAAGGDTFISDIMTRCGCINNFKNLLRYPEVSPQDFVDKDCKLILLSSEPFPFNENHIADVNQLFRGISVELVDGEMFSWYGSRLIKAVPYFEKVINQLSG